MNPAILEAGIFQQPWQNMGGDFAQIFKLFVQYGEDVRDKFRFKKLNTL